MMLKPHPRVKAGFLWLIPVMLLAAGVRLLGLGNDNLWSDEAFSVVTSLGPPGDLLRLLSAAEPHPPLYPFLLAGWLRLFGSSEFIARLPSAFAGIASVPVAASLARTFVPAQDHPAAIPGGDEGARLARAFVSSRDSRWMILAPLVAAVLVALNPFQVWYSQEARMYAQVSFFAGLATLGLLRLWHGRRGSSVLYVVAVLGAAGSHYYGLFIPLAHGFAVVAQARGNRAAVRRWLRAIAIAVVAYLPWTYLAARVFTSYYGGPPGSEDLVHIAISAWARVFAGWSLTWSDALTYAAILSVIAFVGAVLPARGDDDRFMRIVLVFWLLTPFVGGYVVSLVRPLYNERYLIVISLPFILLLARAIVGIGSVAAKVEVKVRRGGKDVAREGTLRVPSFATSFPPLLTFTSTLAATALFLGAIALALIALRNVWQGEYVQSTYDTPVRTIDLLADTSPAGDAVILDGSIQEPLYRYYARTSLPWYTVPERVPLDPSQTEAKLAEIARTHRGAWVLWYASDLQDPTNVIGQWLVAHAYLAFDTYGGNTRLQYYRFAADSDLAFHPTSISLGSAADLQGYAVDGTSLPSGGVAAVDLRLRTLPGAPSHPRVSLRLVDARGSTWTQFDQDVRLPSEDTPNGVVFDDRHGLLIPPGVPPGAYTLYLQAYASSGPLPAQGDGAPIDPGGVRLGTIQVERPARVAWAEDLAGFQSLRASFPGELNLLGYVASDTIPAGQSGVLTLLWSARSDAPRASDLRLALQTADGKIVETRDLALATTSFPPNRWKKGDVVREQYRLPIASSVAPGQYRVSVAPIVADPETKAVGQSDSPSDPRPVLLGLVQVQANPDLIPASPPAHPLAYTLGRSIAFDGYDLASDQARPGGTLDLTLHWRDLAPLDADYTVFVHLLDPSEKVVAQKDQPPDGGRRPTSSWFPDDAILDRYQLPLPSTLPPGDYSVEVGMYQPTDGKRLAVARDGEPAGDRIIVTRIRVGT